MIESAGLESVLFNAEHSEDAAAYVSPCLLRLTYLYCRVEAAELWFENQLFEFQQLADHGRKPGQQSIRVAILDSGVNKADPTIQNAMGRRSAETGMTETEQQGQISSRMPALSEQNCRGFPGALNPLEDRYGHGTCSAALLLRTAPDTELFIARIVDNHGKIDPTGNFQWIVKVIALLRQR
jgi:hypothetical protein